MGTNLANKAKNFAQNLSKLEAKANQVCKELKEPLELPLHLVRERQLLGRLDQMVRDLQKAILDNKQEVIKAKQAAELEDNNADVQQDFLGVIQGLEELERQVRRAEDQMLQGLKERFAMLQELGERQQEYAHQIRLSLENEWTELTEDPSREKAFQMKVRIAKAIQKFEEAECLWYQVIDQRLHFLKACKKTSYFPQLLREASYLNDIAMRSTEFCEAFRKNLEQLKLLPNLCEEFFLLQEELRRVEQRANEMSAEDLNQKLFWIEKGISNCQHHASSKREFHRQCQAELDKIEALKQ